MVTPPVSDHWWSFARMSCGQYAHLPSLIVRVSDLFPLRCWCFGFVQR